MPRQERANSLRVGSRLFFDILSAMAERGGLEKPRVDHRLALMGRSKECYAVAAECNLPTETHWGLRDRGDASPSYSHERQVSAKVASIPMQ